MRGVSLLRKILLTNTYRLHLSSQGLALISPKSSENAKKRISTTYHPGEEIALSLRHSLISLPYSNSPTRAPLVTSLLSASNLAALFIAGTFCDIATIRNVCQCRIRYEGPLLRIGKVYLPGQFCSSRA